MQIQNYIDNLYKKAKSVEEINTYEFYKKVYLSELNVQLVVIKNQHIADNIRDQIISYFNKR